MSHKRLSNLIESLTNSNNNLQRVEVGKKNSSKEHNPDIIIEMSPEQNSMFGFLSSYLG